MKDYKFENTILQAEVARLEAELTAKTQLLAETTEECEAIQLNAETLGEETDRLMHENGTLVERNIELEQKYAALQSYFKQNEQAIEMSVKNAALVVDLRASHRKVENERNAARSERDELKPLYEEASKKLRQKEAEVKQQRKTAKDARTWMFASIAAAIIIGTATTTGSYYYVQAQLTPADPYPPEFLRAVEAYKPELRQLVSQAVSQGVSRERERLETKREKLEAEREKFRDRTVLDKVFGDLASLMWYVSVLIIAIIACIFGFVCGFRVLR